MKTFESLFENSRNLLPLMGEGGELALVEPPTRSLPNPNTDGRPLCLQADNSTLSLLRSCCPGKLRKIVSTAIRQGKMQPCSLKKSWEIAPCLIPEESMLPTGLCTEERTRHVSISDVLAETVGEQENILVGNGARPVALRQECTDVVLLFHLSSLITQELIQGDLFSFQLRSDE